MSAGPEISKREGGRNVNLESQFSKYPTLEEVFLPTYPKYPMYPTYRHECASCAISPFRWWSSPSYGWAPKTPQGRVFKWKAMPFGVASARTLLQELMSKIMSILRRRPVVQELISRSAQMEAHIDDVCLGTNTQEDHLILLGEFFAVCQENHTRLKVQNYGFMVGTMHYVGFYIGYGWWNPAASKAKPLMDAKVRHEDP